MTYLLAGLGAAVCILLFMLWMRHELNCLQTSYFTVESEYLPENFDGAKFVLLSDLHNKSFGENNMRLLSAIERQRPDFIIIAGDLVTAKQKEGSRVGLSLVKELAKKYDVFYARGNHEEKLFIENDEYEEKIRATKAHYLVNESVLLQRGEQSIRITGLSLSLAYFKKFQETQLSQELMKELLGKKKDNRFTILIAHKPAHFPVYQEWGADLVVSGHLHGGIVQFPYLGGFLSPQLEFFPRFDAGKFTLGKSTMIISRGLGSHSIPIRINNRPELVVVTMIQSKEDDNGKTIRTV